MNSKVGSLEEKVKLPPTETISRCYQPQGNRKVIRILTVAVYVLCVSLAAIMLSLYYIFIWDPTIRPFATKGNNCDKIVIPEKIAIRLLNSSEVTAEQFYKHILEQYRILNHLQLQRQQFLQKQQLQLQQFAAANKFQEIFATATIIQTNRNDIFNKRVTPTNGTFLLEPRPPMTIEEQQQQQLLQLQQQQQQLQMQLQQQQHMAPILDTTTTHIRKKSHRKHYNSNNSNSHHRHNTRKNHRKSSNSNINSNNSSNSNNTNNIYNNEELDEQRRYIESSEILKPPVTSVLNEQIFTPIPIPLILNTREEKRSHHHDHATKNSSLQPRRRTTSSASSSSMGYDTPTYMNPFLTGELIFEK